MPRPTALARQGRTAAAWIVLWCLVMIDVWYYARLLGRLLHAESVMFKVA